MAFGNIGLEVSSTITDKVASVTIARGSTTEHQEILVLGDQSDSLAVARVTAAAPASTAYGLNVRPVWSSTNTDQPVSAVQAGTWTVRANLSSTAADNTVRAVQSSAGELNVTVANFSTTAQVSSVGGIVTIRPSDTNFASSAGFHFDSSGALQVTGATASTQVAVSSVAGIVTVAGNTSSNSSAYLSVRLTDGTAFVPVGTDYVDGSTYSTLTAPGIAFNNSSNNTFRVVGTATPLPVQIISGGSTNVVRPSDTNWASSAGFHFNSSGELNVNASFSGSTIVTVSTGSIRVHQSTAADLLVTATLGANLQSTVAPSSGSSGLVVREVIDAVLSTASTSAFAGSTAWTVQSSGASIRTYVTAYSITTTNAGPTKIAFYSSGTMTWPIVMAAVSSAIVGVNLAASPPGYLFRTAASEALTLQTKSSTIAGWHVAVSFYRAP